MNSSSLGLDGTETFDITGVTALNDGETPAVVRIRRDDPDGWHDDLGELAEVSAGEPDATAAEEWPTGAAGSGGQR